MFKPISMLFFSLFFLYSFSAAADGANIGTTSSAHATITFIIPETVKTIDNGERYKVSTNLPTEYQIALHNDKQYRIVAICSGSCPVDKKKARQTILVVEPR